MAVQRHIWLILAGAGLLGVATIVAYSVIEGRAWVLVTAYAATWLLMALSLLLPSLGRDGGIRRLIVWIEQQKLTRDQLFQMRAMAVTDLDNYPRDLNRAGLLLVTFLAAIGLAGFHWLYDQVTQLGALTDLVVLLIAFALFLPGIAILLIHMQALRAECIKAACEAHLQFETPAAYAFE